MIRTYSGGLGSAGAPTFELKVYIVEYSFILLKLLNLMEIRIANRFKLVKRIGSGSFGKIYEGVDLLS